MAQTFSHDDVFRRMHGFLIKGLIADSKTEHGDEILFDDGCRQGVILAPVKIKQIPSLERRLEVNSGKGITTTIVLPKSSEAYDGNYLRDGGQVEYSEQGVKRYHNNTDLTALECYLIDTLGNSIQYFNPQDNSIGSMRFRKHPKWFVAAKTGIELDPKGDQELVDKVEALRVSHGSGKIAENLAEWELRRYIALKSYNQTRDRFREKFVDDGQSRIGPRDLFTIEVHATSSGLLIARLVPAKYETAELGI